MSNSGGSAAPTGCYKCGLPGHWSRDCPSTNPDPNPNPTSTPSNPPKPYTNNFSKANFGGSSSSKLGVASAAAPKPKKAPRVRPKVTPDLLLSDQGLGYILKYFPGGFKYRGRGHEVNDLRNLLRMYMEWHSQLLPYFPFDQFIHKVEDAASRRVKTCIAELKERVANGGDPTKFQESATENGTLHDKEGALNMKEPTNQEEDMPFNDNDADGIHEDIFNEMFDKTVDETSQAEQNNSVRSDTPPSNETVKRSDQSPDGGGGSSSSQITEEQKSLMEAKRQKAIERAAARSRLLKAS